MGGGIESHECLRGEGCWARACGARACARVNLKEAESRLASARLSWYSETSCLQSISLTSQQPQGNTASTSLACWSSQNSFISWSNWVVHRLQGEKYQITDQKKKQNTANHLFFCFLPFLKKTKNKSNAVNTRVTNKQCLVVNILDECVCCWCSIIWFPAILQWAELQYHLTTFYFGGGGSWLNLDAVPDK